MTTMRSRLEDGIDDFDPDVTWHTNHWCRNLQAEAGQDTLTRLCVGTYQIGQALAGGDDEERVCTSYAAAVLHLLAAASHHKVHLADEVRYMRWSHYRWTDCLDYRATLEDLCEVTQQLTYIVTTPASSARRARINCERLSNVLSMLCVRLMSMVPAKDRGKWIAVEMERLTAQEWRSR